MGVRLSGVAQSLVIGGATVALLGFSILGLPHIHIAQFTPFFPLGVGGVAAATLLAFLAFGGFDMVAAAGEEIAVPERNLPRAILLTLFLVLGLYLLVMGVSLGLLPWNELGRSSAPLAAAAMQFLGPAGQRITAVIAILTTAATGNAVLIVTSRVAFAMARDGLLPSPIARVHPTTHVPWGAVLLNGILLALVAITGSVALATAIGGFLYVLHFLFILIALVILRRRGGKPPAFHTPAPHRATLCIWRMSVPAHDQWLDRNSGQSWMDFTRVAGLWSGLHVSQKIVLSCFHYLKNLASSTIIELVCL